jgi:DNA adenine methylase
MKSPIKWAGGKSKIIPEIQEIIKSKKIKYERYIDLFSGSLAIPLDMQIKNGILNDINPYLINLYQIIKSNLEDLLKILNELNLDKYNNKTEFQKIKDEFNKLKFEKNLTTEKKVRLASIFIYLNKRSFNGLYRENKSGIYNVPYRNNKSNIFDEENLKEISNYFNKNNITFENKTFEKFDISFFKKGDLVYLDPPYYPSKKSKFSSYSKDGFSIEQQELLAKLCVELDKKGIIFIMSNSPCPEIKQLYQKFNTKEFYLGRQMRNAEGKSQVFDNTHETNEILIYN